jgi:KUP system potassium uptake protein
VLNYLGQGALVIREPSAIQNPFYLRVAPGAMSAMIILAPLATLIASQAVISDAFSLTAQAIQLGFFPRLNILQTSEAERGQIYIHFINGVLLLGVIALILGMQSSDRLASAYGLAITGTMAIDTLLACVVMLSLWKWNPLIGTLTGLFFPDRRLGFLCRQYSQNSSGRLDFAGHRCGRFRATQYLAPWA